MTSGKPNTLSRRIECIRLLLQAGADVTIQDFYGCTPLECVTRMMASTPSATDLKELKDLLESGIPSSPLHELISTLDYPGIQEYLNTVDKNDNKNTTNQADPKDGTTPIYRAFHMLLDSICVDQISDDTTAPKLKAIITLLLEQGANINQTNNVTHGSSVVYDDSDSESTECTALHECVQRFCNDNDEAVPSRGLAMEVLQMILVQGKADPNIVNEEGITPLSRALSLSLNRSQNINLALDVADMLVQHGGRLNNGSQESSTPFYLLHDAPRRGNMALLNFLLEHRKALEVEINAKGRQGLTPLHFASRSGKLEAARALLDAGADVNVSDDKGKTPLDAASTNGKDDLVELLKRYM